MKAFTSIEQSKKLAEILPLESADNYYSWHDEKYYVVNKDCPYPYSLKEKIPCWSLAALLGVLPYPFLSELSNGIWKCGCYPSGICNYITADSPIDACVAMIEKLHELKML